MYIGLLRWGIIDGSHCIELIVKQSLERNLEGGVHNVGV